jgi:hypothetical protein
MPPASRTPAGNDADQERDEQTGEENLRYEDAQPAEEQDEQQQHEQ